jgi:anti-anti-sigma regulatory factor
MTMPLDGLPTTTRHPLVYVIRAAGVLDMSAVSRLLRVLDAHLALVDQARSPTRHVVIDLSATAAADAAALDALKHATYSTGRLHLGLHLVGTGRLIANLPLSAHRHLSRFSSYPTVQAALHALTVTPT